MKNKKKVFRNISFVITLLFIGTLFYNNINVKAVDKTPSLKVDFSANPNPVVVGEDVDITCTITPQPFEIARPEKEIVLVLDVSGSMSDEIEVEYCKEPSFLGYCAVHFGQRAGHVISSKTKMEAAKEAARNFVDKMKTVENLKIGIVAFSSYGIINPKEKTTSILDKTYGENFYQTYGYNLISSSDTTTLNTIINNLGAEGGTNTGDGLRNAAYLLNKSSSTANKTIVLMTDGLPTFSSHISNKNSNSFNDITKATGGYPNNTGNGTADNGDSTYAKTIGAIIKQKGYNIYSIGYGLGNSNSTSNILLKSIHESMGGTTGNFFADDSGSIDAIFNNIGDKIIDSYEVKDVEINLNLSEDFQLGTGVSKVTLPEDKKIVYRKAANSTSTVTRYEANPVQFTFKVKANKESTNIGGTSFGSGTVTYKDWYGKDESVALNPINIKVNPLNNVPNIRATLLSATPNPVYPGEEVEISYRITPEAFTTKSLRTESGVIDEAIFVTDLSQKMGQNQRMSQLQNGVVNSVLNKSSLSITKFGIIGYNSSVTVGDRNNISDPKNVSMKKTTNVNELLAPLFDIKDANSKDGFRKIFQEGMLKTSSDNARNIDEALNTAKNIFDKFGNPENSKAIILIDTGTSTYSKSIATEIRNKGYKIITVDLKNDTSTTLQRLHSDLGGIVNSVENNNDYLYGTFSDGQNYNSVDADMLKVANRLIDGTIIKAYESISPNLFFDLNDNFDYVDGSASSNLSDITTDGNKLKFQVSPISYTNTGKTADGSYEYTAPEYTVSFKVKIKDGKSGDLSFATNPAINEIDSYKNYISYTKFNNIENRLLVDTPIITINNSDIQHGVYEGITNPSPIYSGNTREFAKGAMVPMAALFNTVRNENNIRLTISPQLTVKDSVKIYSVGANGELQFIANMSVSNNVYSYNLNVTSVTKILVLYNVTLPESAGTHTNTIYVGAESKDAEIKVKDESLPDLF
ncbi:vWA domain-containing protein [Clostridium intestinale]|uniref:von Willebrand factor, type A n=1 Tax=Clostridium intestinale URNW TaxID=1294142 RepID=U2NT74_9CLOT|nr:VWA domain-containing protein [Clostridium intestinale]ERK32388.1 von Willebrand factor, type A [Clostridium intestinale URNW]